MRVRATAFVLVGAACTSVGSSTYRTGPPLPPSNAPVEIRATRDPPGAEELGIVEVSGRVPQVTLDQLVSEFRSRVGSLGGDCGRIDSFATRHEMVLERRDYECGGMETVSETQVVTETAPDGSTRTSVESVPVTRYVSKTCTEDVEVEVATLTLVGRALRVSGRQP